MMVTAATRALAFLLLACAHPSAADPANCTIVGYRYDPPQMSGTLRTVLPTWESCQRQCQNTVLPVPCTHFAFWPDGGCLMQNDSAVLIKAEEPFGGGEVITGPPSCDDPTKWPAAPGQGSTSPAASATSSTQTEATTTAAPATNTTTTTPLVFAYVDIEMKNLDADAVPSDKLGDLISVYAKCIAGTAGLPESQVVDMHGNLGVTLSSDDPFKHELIARRLQSTSGSDSTVAPVPMNYSTFITAKLLEYEDEEVKGKLEGNATFYEHIVAHTVEVIGANSSAIKAGGLTVGHVHVHDKGVPVVPIREVGASSGMPWWGYVLIIFAIVACLAAVIYLTMCQGGEKKKKSKKDTSKRKYKKLAESAAEAPAAYTAPLVEQAASQPVETVAEPVAMYTSVPVTSPPGATMAVAAPAVLAPAVQPLEFMQMPLQMGSVGSPVMMQPPAMMQPQVMVQPQMQPQVMLQPQVVYQQY